MTENKKIFFSISLLSLYIYFKDKYKNTNMDNIDLDADFQYIVNKLSKIDKYQHLTNKQDIVQDAYNKFLDCKKDSIIDEDKMFEIVHNNVQALDEDDRKYILNCIIFIANRDKKISDEEKELVVQVAHLLNLKTEFKKIMEDFNKSEFAEPISSTKIVILSLILLSIIISVCFYFYKEQNNKINIFKGERVVFSEISFNRYVIYKNSFINDGHFLKQGVFYFDGTAEIGINPKNIKYDVLTKDITILYKDNPFVVSPTFNYILLADKIDPKGITEDEAKLVAGGLTIVAGYAGAKAGGFAGSIVGTFMPSLKLIAPITGTIIGGLAGGTGTYFFVKNKMEGMKLTSDISKKEEEKVKEDGRKLIAEVLNNDVKMLELYINSFEIYLKSKYASIGIEVNNIKYKEVK